MSLESKDAVMGSGGPAGPITPIIPSGGSGSRLWPLLRALYPKQFLALASELTMIQESALRVAGDRFAALLVICNDEHRFIVAEQLRSKAVRPAEIILEPVGGNTASAVYVRSKERLVAVAGLEDVVVNATDDAVLVVNRSRAQDVKHIVERLKAERRDEHAVHRPWGSYRGVDRGSRFQVKRIVVKSGERLSLQMHHHRAEHWIVVEGTALVTRGDEQLYVYENQSVHIPMGTVHRLESAGKVSLHMIEVQPDGYLGEDDIVRLNDEYGRRLDIPIAV